MTVPVCEIHKSHQPVPIATESHHVVPRAWQAVWRPEAAQHVVWAPTTIELCPTGHRAVHEILVAIMKCYGAYDRGLPTQEARYDEARKIVGRQYGRRAEFPIAVLGIERWIGYGGALDLLVDHKQYGYGVRFAPSP